MSDLFMPQKDEQVGNKWRMKIKDSQLNWKMMLTPYYHQIMPSLKNNRWRQIIASCLPVRYVYVRRTACHIPAPSSCSHCALLGTSTVLHPCRHQWLPHPADNKSFHNTLLSTYSSVTRHNVAQMPNSEKVIAKCMHVRSF